MVLFITIRSFVTCAIVTVYNHAIGPCNLFQKCNLFQDRLLCKAKSQGSVCLLCKSPKFCIIMNKIIGNEIIKNYMINKLIIKAL